MMTYTQDKQTIHSSPREHNELHTVELPVQNR
jgi:hypothetical protein